MLYCKIYVVSSFEHLSLYYVVLKHLFGLFQLIVVCLSMYIESLAYKCIIYFKIKSYCLIYTLLFASNNVETIRVWYNLFCSRKRSGRGTSFYITTTKMNPFCEPRWDIWYLSSSEIISTWLPNVYLTNERSNWWRLLTQHWVCSPKLRKRHVPHTRKRSTSLGQALDWITGVKHVTWSDNSLIKSTNELVTNHAMITKSEVIAIFWLVCQLLIFSIHDILIRPIVNMYMFISIQSASNA